MRNSHNPLFYSDDDQSFITEAKQNKEKFCQGETAKLAVYGNPIAQSKSPAIHNMFAEQFGISISYERILGEEGHFLKQLDEFFTDVNAVGANITMPFKEQAASWATHRSFDVEQASAANTLFKTGNGFYAQTTDGKGLVADLLRNKMPVKNSRALIIGAGGAARGAISALLADEPLMLYVTNRTSVNAKRLVDLSNDERVVALTESECQQYEFDLIINATSLSLNNAIPNLADDIFKSKPAVYDMVYKSKDTVFIEHAKALGCSNVADGLGMLVGQAAESFYIWFSVRPDVEPVLAFLREELKSSE